MLKAGSLLYAIFVTLIAALLTMSILWGHYFGTIQIQNSIKLTQIENTIHSAINKALVFPDSLPYNQELVSTLFNDDLPVTLKRTHWGMYDIITGSVEFRNDTIKQLAFIGQTAFDADSLALYVSDKGKDVYISGNILIKGRCDVPRGRFKYAYIGSQKLGNKQIFPMKMNKSKEDLPNINEAQIIYNQNILFASLGSLPMHVELTDYLAERDSVVISFLEPTLVLSTQEAYALRNKTLIGNIMIVSTQLISIESSTKLDKVLIYAPEIRVEKDVKGNMQIFASDSIFVDENCMLNFPSCITMLSPNVSYLKISKGSTIIGNVIQYQSDTKLSKSLLQIDAETEVLGLVYSNGQVQQQGKIAGSLYANQLYLKTNAGYYENHLVDTEIDFSKLPKAYVSCNLFNNKKQRILSWQY
ncbi:MAG: hypothetical protein JXQ69_00970 [Paludibacteraceae bacterium]|nr:hypothetical protein [Paludibacteraceae bacterium]